MSLVLDYIDRFIISGAIGDRELVTGEYGINGAKSVDEKTWTIGENWPQVIDTVLCLRMNEGEVTQNAKNRIREMKDEMQLLLLKKQLPDEIRVREMFGEHELFPEQIADSDFLAAQGSGLIFSQMRTGKSLLTLVTLSKLNAYPALIVCKSANVFEWERQLTLYEPGRKTVAISSGMTAAKRSKIIEEFDGDFLIISHNLLEKHTSIKSYGGLSVEQRQNEKAKGKYATKELDSKNFRGIVGDEAHRLANPKAAVTRALWSVGDRAAHRFSLTGTPAPNHIDELWGLLRFCWPDQFPAKSKWLNRYVDMRENYFGILECHGLKQETKLQWDSVFDTLHVRRKRSRGPEKEYRVLPVEVSPGQKRLAKDLVKNLIVQTEDAYLTAPEEMSLRHNLSLLACGTPETEDGKIISLKAPSSKMDTLLSILEESDEPAIVVGVNKAVIALIRSTLQSQEISHVLFIGGSSKDAQREAVRKFEAGEARVIVMSSAGAEGVDLPSAKRTIFVQRSYDLVFDLQIESRNTGPGQTADTVEVIDIVAKDTTELDVYESFFNKDHKLHTDLLKDKSFYKRSLGIK